MKTLVLINPSSAGGKALESQAEIESGLKGQNIDYVIHISKSLEDMIDTVKNNLSNDFENFIAAGGDGTIHYIANALAGSNKKWGLYLWGPAMMLPLISAFLLILQTAAK